MKKITLIFVLTFVTFLAKAQIKEPAKWSEPKLSKTNPTVGETIESELVLLSLSNQY